jgi:hypothetical protein
LTVGQVRAMQEGLRPDEAARALVEIDQRRDQVIKRTMIPWWYWWAVAVLILGLSAAVESRRPVAIGVGAAVFALGILVATGWVVIGTLRSAQLRRDLLGPVGVLAILGFVALVEGVALPTGFILDAIGVRYPATVAALFGGVVMVIGGPVLMRFLRQVMMTNPAGSQR